MKTFYILTWVISYVYIYTHAVGRKMVPNSVCTLIPELGGGEDGLFGLWSWFHWISKWREINPNSYLLPTQS